MVSGVLKKIGESSLFSRNTPKFWEENCLTAQLMLPLSVIYFLVKRATTSKPNPKKFPAKIICIGNATAGGAGKTPTAVSIYKTLQRFKPAAKICFVTTGFKGKLRGPIVVDKNSHSFADVGDEPMILAQYAPTVMCKSRLEAVEFAVAQGFEYIILDDGLHDKRMAKDLTLLVIDGKYGFGNGIVMPAGPLRDRLDYATEGTDQIILIGKDEKNSVVKVKHATRKNFDPIHSFIDPVSKFDENQVYVAFAGIGRPQKFFDMLKKELKLVVPETIEFPDHHIYTTADIEHLKTIAAQQKAKLITTEKDFIKLPHDFASGVECMKIELKFEDRRVEELLNQL